MHIWKMSSSLTVCLVSSVDFTTSGGRSPFEKILSRPEFTQLYGDLDCPGYVIARPVQGILSRWFTRGWTLQELLAPHFLLFLDKNWCSIGERTQWSTQIQAMTAIDHRYFSRERYVHDKDRCPAATKFAWASLRSTSRPEDQIYCLIGLFNVNMPLLYGEGVQNAFYRLQRKIIKHSDDESILAWKAPIRALMDWHDILAPELEFFRWLTFFGHRDARELELFRFDADRPEFAMTNKGLKVTVRLKGALTIGGLNESRSRNAECPTHKSCGLRYASYHLAT